MADHPPHFRIRKAAGGRKRYSWEPATPLGKAGWPTVPLGFSDVITQHEAEKQAKQINDMVAAWRAGYLAEIPEVILELKVVKRDRRPVSKRLARARASRGTCGYLIERYLESPEFLEEIRETTRLSYRPDIELIREWCGDLPLAAVTAKSCKDLFQQLRRRAPFRATKIVAMGRLIWSWGKSEDLLTANPWRDVVAKKGPRKVPKIWTPENVAHFVQVADRLGEHAVGTAVLLNSWLGQRKADVLKWDRRLYLDGRLSLVQQKTNATVSLPLGMVSLLSDRLAADEARAATRGITTTYLIYHPDTGHPYSDAGMRQSFNRVRDEAAKAMPEIAGLDMMRLRHTAVTQLADAGCSTLLIRSITGHSLASVNSILELYGVMTMRQADAAFRLRMAAEGVAETTTTPDEG